MLAISRKKIDKIFMRRSNCYEYKSTFVAAEVPSLTLQFKFSKKYHFYKCILSTKNYFLKTKYKLLDI